MSPSTNTSHFVLSPTMLWGHVRPFCSLAMRLVCEQENITVTFIVDPHVLDKTRAELSHQFLQRSSEALQRIRILSPWLTNGVELSERLERLADAYPAAYETLYHAKPITCSVTGTTFDAVPAPRAVILDFFTLSQLRATRAISGHSVPVIISIAGGAGAIIRLFGPASMGGAGDLGEKIDAETARTGLPEDKVAFKIYNHKEGKLVHVPGLPAMYDHEFSPQTLPSEFQSSAARKAYLSFRECDAIIVTTSYSFESVSLDAMKQWFSDMQKEIHVLGPLLPAGYGIRVETQNTEERVSNDVGVFLGEMLLHHGKKSVFFISFGTLFCPPVSEYLDELVEALIEKKAPFILASASSGVRAKLSEQLTERIKSSGLGMLTIWSPQDFILNHPATGWFLTHGGFNSVTESLGSGIPLICWPIGFDQPAIVVHTTENLNVAFELIQVRTGDGLKPMHRNGITPEGTREAMGIEIRQTIDLCRGEKGQIMRSNAEKLKVEFGKAWDEDGMARQEMRNFLHKYT